MAHTVVRPPPPPLHARSLSFCSAVLCVGVSVVDDCERTIVSLYVCACVFARINHYRELANLRSGAPSESGLPTVGPDLDA